MPRVLNVVAPAAREISFFVDGIPAPGGSKRFVGFSKLGRAKIIDDAGDRNKNWRARVAAHAYAHRPKQLLEGPLRVFFCFVMPRPLYHYVGRDPKKGLRPDAPEHHIVRPDALKLARSTEDSLTEIIWVDDAQTFDIHPVKIYGDKPGCQVVIEIL